MVAGSAATSSLCCSRTSSPLVRQCKWPASLLGTSEEPLVVGAGKLAKRGPSAAGEARSVHHRERARLERGKALERDRQARRQRRVVLEHRLELHRRSDDVAVGGGWSVAEVREEVAAEEGARGLL